MLDIGEVGAFDIDVVGTVGQFLEMAELASQMCSIQ